MSSLNDFRPKANQIAFTNTETLKAGNVQKAIELLQEQIQNSGNGEGELSGVLREISNAWNFVKFNAISNFLLTVGTWIEEYGDMFIEAYETVFKDIEDSCDLLGVEYTPYTPPYYLELDYFLEYNDIILIEFSSALEYLADRFDVEIDDSEFYEKRLIGGKFFIIFDDQISDLILPKLENESTYIDYGEIVQDYVFFPVYYKNSTYYYLEEYINSKFP